MRREAHSADPSEPGTLLGNRLNSPVGDRNDEIHGLGASEIEDGIEEDLRVLSGTRIVESQVAVTGELGGGKQSTVRAHRNKMAGATRRAGKGQPGRAVSV